MKEIRGELWDYYGKPDTKICLTVNGTIKANGCAVMGRGCALEATQRFPNIAKVWGQRLKDYRLEFMYLHEFDLFMFPVKYNWWEQASLELIAKSAKALCSPARFEAQIILPRPGCGNGRLTWAEVKPVIEFLPDNVLVLSR
jgi:hypothetical protein